MRIGLDISMRKPIIIGGDKLTRRRIWILHVRFLVAVQPHGPPPPADRRLFERIITHYNVYCDSTY